MSINLDSNFLIARLISNASAKPNSNNLSPPTPPSENCIVSYHDHIITTPWGKVKPSGVKLVHRYKSLSKKP